MASKAYSKEWIKDLHDGKKPQEFCKHIYIFKKNGTKCSNISRNTLLYWENGTSSLPSDVEVVLSLILYEYDYKIKGIAKDKVNQVVLANCYDEAKSNERYEYARKRMNELIQVDLYCRNVHDALLIQVARGIISFEELPALEAKIEKALKLVELPTEDRNIYAMARNTVSISSDLCKVDSVKSLENLITVVHKNSFASANRIIGARFKSVYEERDRYGESVSLEKAIFNLAPNYQNSYLRMFKSSFISRNWIIDLCMHLKFDNDEINEMLEKAHMALLTENELICDTNIYFREKSLVDKFKIMFILAGHLKDDKDVYTYISLKHILESFSIYEHGNKLLRALDRIMVESDDWKDVWTSFSVTDEYDAWVTYTKPIGDAYNYVSALQLYCRSSEYRYFFSYDERLKNVNHLEDINRLQTLVALYYSILLNKNFEGKLKDKELMEIKNQFSPEDGSQRAVYSFVSTMLGIFLGNEDVYENDYQEFYINQATKKSKSIAMDLDEILGNLFESILVFG